MENNLRVHRKRTKGYKLPKGVICVGRGSKWGNPFKLVGDMIYVDAGHRRRVLDKWVCYGNQNPEYDGGGFGVEDVVKLFRDMVLDPSSHEVEPEIRDRFQWMHDHISELKDKRLACWCNLSASCHADELIELSKIIKWKK